MEPPQQAKLWPKKTLRATAESDEALWSESKARAMPHVLIGRNPPGQKFRGREDGPFSIAYGEPSRDEEVESYG
jgi:hypothetical protein